MAVLVFLSDSRESAAEVEGADGGLKLVDDDDEAAASLEIGTGTGLGLDDVPGVGVEVSRSAVSA